MKKIAVISVLAMVFMLAGVLFNSASAQDWDSSPYNWKNSDNNWDNSPNNWKNSPNNWDNSQTKWGNDRLLRDNQGNIRGYAVPRNDGGVNFYTPNGKRWGYVPGK